ncbi:MAG: DNA gyrase subunit A [Oscillospiraceae bacterium]|nr:DNA gyrase subunit A [Oscillospiraceae bacterium]
MLLNDNTKYIDVDIDKEMRNSFLNYSMSVIVSRALPDVRDGLKPVHRRIMYTMYENNLDSAHEYRKSATTVGDVLGSYHPHGDASVYDAMVRLAQDFSLRYPLVDGQGNFGSVDGDPPAAYRYTEARMKKIADEMLRDIDKETVDFQPNFDESKQEPCVLPARIPNLLINGSIGIAVGMATNVPPHNLGEVCDGIVHLIDNPDADYVELMEFIPGPDFPTGGVIMGRSGIRSAYATGKGKIILRGRANIEEHGNGRYRIVITEIPYMVNKAMMVERIADLVKEKRIEGISDLRDESDRQGMRVVVELKKEANPQVVLNHLYSLTQLQDTVGANMLALDGGIPKVMDLKYILQRYIDHQCDVMERRTRFDLKKAQERQHLLEGLKIACDNIDEVIRIIRTSYDNAKDNLMERFGLSEIQANAILNMQLRRLQGLEREKIENELAELAEKIDYYTRFLADHRMVLDKVKEDVIEIKEKYADPRRTEIMQVSGEVDIEDLIPEEECIFTYTKFGYVKRQPKDVYQAQRRGGRGISGMTRRDEDYVQELFMAGTHDFIFFATDKGRVYRLKGYEIPEGSRNARGVNIINLIQLQPDEKVTAIMSSPKGLEEGNIVMVTKKGIIKRTEVSAYNNVRKSGLICISLDEGDELIWTRLTKGDDELIVATKDGVAIRFSEQDVRLVSRSARGVKAIELREGDEVVGMGVCSEGSEILTVTEDGKGRRTSIDEYRLQTRGGKGVRNYETEKYGKVCGVRIVNSDLDAILISQSGIIIRTHIEDIALQSRYAGGVKVMKLGEDDKVVTFAATLRDDSEETVEVEAAEETEMTQAAETETAENAEE